MERDSLRRQSAMSVLFGTLGLIVAILYIPQLLHTNWLALSVLVVLATTLEVLPIPMRQSLTTLVPVVPMAAMVVDGPAQAIWALVIAAFATPLLMREWNFLTAFFNAGQYALSVLLMILTFRPFHGNLSARTLNSEVVVGVVISSLVFLLFNHLFISVLNASRGTLEYGATVSAFLADLLNIAICWPFAFLMIGASEFNWVVGPVMILPIIILAYILRVHRQTRDLQIVHQATTRLTSEFDIRAIAQESAKIARKLTTADVVVVFVLDQTRTRLVPEVVYPANQSHLFHRDGISEEMGGVIWSTIHSGEFVYISDARKDKRVRWFKTDGPQLLSMAIFPMQTHMSQQGAIVCYAERSHAFTQHVQYVSALANQVSVLFENARLYQELQERTRRDSATGLYNYRFFYEELAARVAASVDGGMPVSVMIVDIDFFKKFNDTYGHLAGDAVLMEVGHLLQRLSGPDAFVARYGGEEFALLLPSGRDAAFEAAERIRDAVRQLSVEFHGYRLQGITVSIGIASCPLDSDRDRDLLLKADSAMYWGAKQRGRNRTAVYTPEFDAQLFVDGLTGLYTFHMANIRVREEVLRGMTSWCAICIDLQQFGHVNNAFGFDVGDQVLRQTGMMIRECLRHDELACRYGGDEMLILLPDVTESEALAVQDRVVKAINSHRFQASDNVVLHVRASATHHLLDHVEHAADLFNRVANLFSELQSKAGESMA
ncbi:sensor domain-containing diguanylate cyclase [Alicyclobacillus fastidiosus]|uniref:Sensor domain-containing diguanylate cyclase n=1 Tax=Alicyclobacillus fastidiosus TaxID=392011 RepID=A0ABV5ACX4_9BACL|nr:sensor domain-containing diguanylate cyclase [Alicyclobacillus fastidiosus]WEH11208.1 sensor domain-containing diguanylate cyclase [Alicyclobacillus fastidiosus]